MKWKYITYTYLSFLFVLTFTKAEAQYPNWSPPDGSSFQFSANVIADIKLIDAYSYNANDTIAFFYNEEVRGLGLPLSLGNGVYRHFITIYSNQPLDTMMIKVYHQATDHVYEVQTPFLFQAQSITGEIENPYIINIYPDNDAPIWLLPVPAQQTVQGLAFDPIDMNQYLVQPDIFAVEWSYTPNPALNVSFNGSILQVSGVDGYTGQSQLVVRATEQTTSALISELRGSNASRNVQITQQFAETTITFNVTPIYAAPLWQPKIPSQGIVVGSQFDAIHLHDYENQFQGPFIQYDYVPLIEVSNPIDTVPNWILNQNYGTSMSVVAQLDYTPKYQFHHEDDVLAAFVGNELRGVVQRNNTNGLYYLSIGGDQLESGMVTLKLYSEAMKRVFVLDSVFQFQPYDILGNDAIPYTVEFAPIVPMVSDLPVSNGIYTMPLTIVNPAFIGSVTFTFYAIDPAYPEFLRDETNASFCIVTDSNELMTYYQDIDGDGLGNPLASIQSCVAPEGYVNNGDDCNDNDGGNSGITLTIIENSGIVNDGKICASASTMLSVDQLAQSYLWSTGQTSQSIAVNPIVTSYYTVTATYGTACMDVKTDTLLVEGTVVKNSNNDGFGSLRNVLECIDEGGTITYDLPIVNNTLLTSELAVNKDVWIQGITSLRPEIKIDFTTANNGIVISPNKKLTLDNIDVKAVNLINQKTFVGPGTIEINGITNISN